MIIITLKNGIPISLTNENDLFAYYQTYAESGFLEAFWDSPNLAMFEAGCDSKAAQRLSSVSEVKDIKEAEAFIVSLTERRAERDQTVYETVASYLNEDKRKVFWEYNRQFVKRLIDSILWSRDNARTFYEFLLLYLQLNQKIIGSDGYSGFLDCEKEMLINKLYHTEQKIDNGSNMYSDGNGGVYFLCEDGIHRAIYQNDNVCVSAARVIGSSSERIRSFSLYDGNSFIVIYADGQLKAVDEEIRNRWDSCGKPPIQTVVSYGKLYQLLTEDGKIIANVDWFGDGKEAAVQVGAGLNCLSAIVDSDRRLVTTEETIRVRDQRNRNYIGVRTAGMRAGGNPGGEKWFLIDESDNMQYFDGAHKPSEKNVRAASICGRGIYYVQDTDLWEYSFETKVKRHVSQCVCNTNEAVKGFFCESAGGVTRVFCWPESQAYPDRIIC